MVSMWLPAPLHASRTPAYELITRAKVTRRVGLMTPGLVLGLFTSAFGSKLVTIRFPEEMHWSHNFSNCDCGGKNGCSSPIAHTALLATHSAKGCLDDALHESRINVILHFSSSCPKSRAIRSLYRPTTEPTRLNGKSTPCNSSRIVCC
jgi:hypothetical protein